MAKKKTLSAARKPAAKKTRGGTSRQHAIAGRKGGLAPHICRGSECTKMRKEAAAKKRVGASASKAKKVVAGKASALKSTAKKATKSVYAGKGIAKKAAAAKKSVHSRSAHTRKPRVGLFEGLFEDMYSAPRSRQVASKKRTVASKAKKAAPKKAAVKRASHKARRRKLA